MHAILASGALLVALSGAAAGAQPGGVVNQLFVATEPEASPAAPEPGAEVLRQRLAHVDRRVLDAARLKAGQGSAPVLLLNLFDDTEFRAVVTWTEPTSAGYSLSGYPEEWRLDSFTMVVNGDIVVGTVRVRAATYSIRTLDTGVVAIRQVDPLSMEPKGDDVATPRTVVGVRSDRTGPIRPPNRVRGAAAPSVGRREDGSQIDVLVAYTRAARDRLGGRRRMEAAIDLQEAEVNQAYRESGVFQRIRVVHTVEVAYRERGRDLIDVLHHLASKGDGHMDRVHALRDRYAADIVSLGHVGGGVAYIAWRSDQEGSAFNVIPAGAGAYFAHELGHNMGLHHDRYTLFRGCGTACNHDIRPFAYSVGYVNQRAFDDDPGDGVYRFNGRGWYTLMAYNRQCYDRRVECYRTMRFSNPDRDYTLEWGDFPSDPGGVPGTRQTLSVSGPADARRTLNRTRRAVANWRRAPCLRDGERVRLQASNGQYLVAVGNGGGNVVANRSQPVRGTRFTVVDANGGCVESGDVVSLHTSDGFYLRARRGGGSTLDATAPRATPWARFTARRETTRRHAVRIHDTISLRARSGHYVVAARGGGRQNQGGRRVCGAVVAVPAYGHPLARSFGAERVEVTVCQSVTRFWVVSVLATGWAGPPRARNNAAGTASVPCAR